MKDTLEIERQSIYEKEDGKAGEKILLSARGLRKIFGGQIVLDGINLELHQGEVVLLQGENGSGKTTLLNILTGNIEPDAGEISYFADSTPRDYQFPRRWWQEFNPLDHFTPEFVAREGIGRTWQNVRLFGTQSLRNNIAVAHSNQPGENPLKVLFMPNRGRVREAEIQTETNALLAHLGLADREDSSADKISLGQSKRVAIGRAIAAGASILFLDEPLAGLDRQGVADVLSMLETCIREQTITLVIIEHLLNQHYLSDLVTSHWLLKNGKIMFNRFSSNESKNDCQSPIRNRQPHQIPRHEWFSHLAGADAEIHEEVLPKGALLTRIRRPGIFRDPLKPVFEIRNLIVKRGPRLVIGRDEDDQPAGLNLTFYEGEIGILQAPNGWGKTTLMDAIAGLIQPDEGEFLVDGVLLNDDTCWQRNTTTTTYVQSSGHLFPSLTGKELIKIVPSARNIQSNLLNKKISQMSGGEKQHVSIKAANMDRKIRLFDEPFSALDFSNSNDVLMELNRGTSGVTLIAIPL